MGLGLKDREGTRFTLRLANIFDWVAKVWRWEPGGSTSPPGATSQRRSLNTPIPLDVEDISDGNASVIIWLQGQYNTFPSNRRVIYYVGLTGEGER